jgi:hypothetical protein
MRLQILEEDVPSGSKVAFLDMRTSWEGGRWARASETGQRLEMRRYGRRVPHRHRFGVTLFGVQCSSSRVTPV